MRRLSVLAVALVVSASAGDWVTGGGNAWRSGLTDEIGPTGRENIAWQGTIPGIFGMPVYIWQDKLVTMRFQSIDYAPIVCHDLATGETLWTRDFPGPNSRSLPIGFRDGRVYAINFQESQHDTLYALDAADGHILWQSRATTWMSITESASFAPNGDLLVPAANFKIARVNCTTGDTVWTANRVWPVTGSADICVHDSTVYAFSGDIGSFFISAWDLATGRYKYKTRLADTHPGGPLPQSAPMVGDDGTIYAHKPGDNVTALKDDGDSLKILWTHEVSGDSVYYSLFSHFAVGPDGSVYCGSDGRIQRLDPVSGVCVDSSLFIQDPTSIYFGLRMAIGMDSTVYVTTGTSNAALYALTRDLRILWADTIPNINTSGPALAQGVLAVAGAGAALKVYRGLTGIEGKPGTVPVFPVSASAVGGIVRLKLAVPAAGPVAVRIYDATGRVVTTVREFRPAGEQVVELPTSASGVGFAAVTAAGQTATVKFVAVR
jgi:outer membrane protein assembly factor BamB